MSAAGLPDPIHGAGPYSPGNWLTERLPLLHGLGLALLPGGPDKRPTVGDDWPDHPGLSIEQLQAAAPRCICWHIGAAGTEFIAIDLDGLRAIAHCEANGCFPLAVNTWRIQRTSTHERLKLVFRVSDPAVRQRLVDMRKTTRIGKRSGGPADPGDEFAVFCRPGTQIVILGNHYTKESGYTEHDDQYAWAGVLPHQAMELPPEWLALLAGTLEGDQPLVPKPPAPLPAAVVPMPFQGPVSTATDADKARAALAVLPVLDCGTYDDWIQVGMALHSVGDDSLLQDWDRWSAGDPGKYEKGACEKHWRSFKPGGGIGLGSLLHQAKAYGLQLRRPPEQHPGESPVLAEQGPPERRGKPAAAAAEADDEEAAAGAAIVRTAGAVSIALEDVLPDSIAKPLTQLARAYPADPLALLLPLLILSASVVGNRCRIRVKETWDEPFLLWGMNLAGASSGKSPMADYLIRPMTRWAVTLKEAQKAEMREWIRARDSAVGEKGNTPAAKAEWVSENPPPPPGRELFVMDATLEKIGSILNGERTVGLASFHDELSTWFAQHQRSGKGGPDHRSNWNSLWNGRTLKVDRQQGESYLIANTAVSVFGSSTLALYEAQLQATLKANHNIPDPDGMQARFLVCLPQSITWRYNPLEVATSDLLLNLYQAIDAAVPPCSDPSKPVMLGFAPEAWALLEPLLNDLAAAAETSGFARGQWLGKLRGNVVRLAGVLHVIDHSLKQRKLTDAIEKSTAERALNLALWQVAQFDRLQALTGGETPGLEAAVAKLLAKGVEWQKRHGAAPVKCQQVRDWRIPGTGRKNAEVMAWLLQTVGEAPTGPLGWVERLRQGAQWHPPTP